MTWQRSRQPRPAQRMVAVALSAVLATSPAAAVTQVTVSDDRLNPRFQPDTGVDLLIRSSGWVLG